MKRLWFCLLLIPYLVYSQEQDLPGTVVTDTLRGDGRYITNLPAASADSNVFTTQTQRAADSIRAIVREGLKPNSASPTLTGFLTGSASMRGTATFTTTAVRVAVYIPGATSTDFFVLTPTGSSVVTTTNLTALAKTDSLVIFRGSSGTSGAKVNWILMR